MSSDPTPEIPVFAEKGSALLFHFVFLPDLAARKRLAWFSAELCRAAFSHPFYVLKAEERSGALLTGVNSLPHVTLMHFWATKDAAAAVMKAFAESGKGRTEPQRVVACGFSASPALPRFQGKVDAFDAVAWIDIERSEELMQTQARFHQAVLRHGGAPVTALGANWAPHVTLAAEVCDAERQDTRDARWDKAGAPPLGIYEGGLMLGISGPNGQFRGAWTFGLKS